MCYFAQVLEQYDEYVRMFGTNIDLTTFAQLYRWSWMDCASAWSSAKTRDQTSAAVALNNKEHFEELTNVI